MKLACLVQIEAETVVFAFTPINFLIFLVLYIIQSDVKSKIECFLDLLSNQYMRTTSLNLNRVNMGLATSSLHVKNPTKKYIQHIRIYRTYIHMYIHASIYVYLYIDFFIMFYVNLCHKHSLNANMK